MKLKDKLARLSGAGPSVDFEPAPAPELGPEAEAAVVDPRVERLRALLRAKSSGTKSAAPVGIDAPVGTGLPGGQQATPHGLLHVSERLLPTEYRHGMVPVERALDADAKQVAKLALDVDLARVDLARALFFDTETTGLAGGTGTLPFLIGVGWFEDRRLRVRQFFVRRPGEEAPVLCALASLWAQASCLVSFNGKSFDWPLLRSRFILNRLPVPGPLPHLDLLHCARRVYKRRLGTSRLVQVESEVLGFERVGDVSSGDIPALYFSYLRGGGGEQLRPIFDHNANDIVALAAILGNLADGFADPSATHDARDALGYAQVAARAGDPDRAMAFAEAAAADVAEPASADALVLAATLTRRQGDFSAAVALLERALVAAKRGTKAPIHLMLAKLYEHRLRDLHRAYDHACRSGRSEKPAAHNNRLARLQRRLRG